MLHPEWHAPDRRALPDPAAPRPALRRPRRLRRELAAVSKQPIALIVTVEGGDYAPHEVRLAGELIGYRPHDGSCHEEVVAEVAGELAALLRERLGWPDTDKRDTE